MRRDTFRKGGRFDQFFRILRRGYPLKSSIVLKRSAALPTQNIVLFDSHFRMQFDARYSVLGTIIYFCLASPLLPTHPPPVLLPCLIANVVEGAIALNSLCVSHKIAEVN